MTDPHTPSPRPKPGPKPGPKPTPGRPARPTPSPVPVGSPISNDPAKFGRIADDGTVYVTTGDGERAIGSWQAGSHAEGLAHFGARFDDLATEVELLEARVKAHPEDAAAITKQAEQLRASLDEAAVIGDLAALDRRLGQVIEHAARAGEKENENRQRRRAEAIERKEALASEAEDIAENSTEWKAAGDRIRAILDEWKAIKGIDRATDDALWKRYSRARDSFNRRRGAHFAELDRNRASAKAKKEELIERAEALQNSTEWKETARKYRDLMSEWKAAGRAQRDQDDKLWDRFRAAQDHFFNARDAVNAERDRAYEANAEAKDALIAEYSPLIEPDKGIDQAKAKLRELQDKWDEIGYVPRSRIREYEEKIAAVEKRVADAEDARWRRTDPEAEARAAQFEKKVADFEAQAEQAAQKGNEKKAAELKAQAEQWRQFAQTARQAIAGE
nr:DUF349 domain-containing protein [Corynebacterium yudongzhengii]